MRRPLIRQLIPSAILGVGLLGGSSVLSSQTLTPKDSYSGQTTGTNSPTDYKDDAGRTAESTGRGGWGLFGLLGLLGLFGARRTRTTTYETRGTTFEPRMTH